MAHPAGQPGLLVVGRHAQSLDEELHGLVDAVLVVEAQAPNIQSVSVGGVQAQDVAVRGGFRETQ